jgi:hypothetical protein
MVMVMNAGNFLATGGREENDYLCCSCLLLPLHRRFLLDGV